MSANIVPRYAGGLYTGTAREVQSVSGNALAAATALAVCVWFEQRNSSQILFTSTLAQPRS